MCIILCIYKLVWFFFCFVIFLFQNIYSKFTFNKSCKYNHVFFVCFFFVLCFLCTVFLCTVLFCVLCFPLYCVFCVQCCLRTVFSPIFVEWWDMVLCFMVTYFGYIVVVSFIGGSREKSPTTFITWCCVKYTSLCRWMVFELTTDNISGDRLWLHK